MGGWIGGGREGMREERNGNGGLLDGGCLVV